jgi:hypothetical protein
MENTMISESDEPQMEDKSLKKQCSREANRKEKWICIPVRRHRDLELKSKSLSQRKQQAQIIKHSADNRKKHGDASDLLDDVS